jgi:hypothetical protein
MSPKFFRRERNIRTWPERARIFGPAILLSLLALIVTYHFVQPAPPRHIVLATGQEGGAYFLYGLRYQAELAREGIAPVRRALTRTCLSAVDNRTNHRIAAEPRPIHDRLGTPPRNSSRDASSGE